MFERRTADITAAVVFVVFLVGGWVVVLVPLLTDGVAELSDWSATPTLVEKVVTERRVTGETEELLVREETERSDSRDIVRIVLGESGIVLLRVLLALMAAFLVAAAVQRTMLGRFGFRAGPIELGDIPPDAVERALETIDAAAEASGAQGAAEAAPATPSPSPGTRHNPQLEFVEFRIELEKRMRSIASVAGLPAEGGAGQLLRTLEAEGLLEQASARALRELVDYGNRAVHGARVPDSAIDALRRHGPETLSYLDWLLRERTPTVEDAEFGRFSEGVLALLQVLKENQEQGRETAIEVLADSPARAYLSEAEENGFVESEHGRLALLARGQQALQLVDGNPMLARRIEWHRRQWGEI